MRGIFANKMSAFGALVIAVLGVIAITAGWISPHDPTYIDVRIALSPPSSEHPFGTDSLGRDVLARMIYGTRISLAIGFIAVGISCLIGITIGSIAGYYGGWVDAGLMRFVDVMLCFPVFFLILSVIALLEPSIVTIMVVIGSTSWMGVARLIRAEILTLKERDFVHAARIMGASDSRIIMRHLIPNAIGPVLVNATLGVGAAILTESALSFLGIGVQPPTPSWGNIVTEGKATLGVAWWLMVFPGAAIFLTVLSYNLLGEGLRDALELRVCASVDKLTS